MARTSIEQATHVRTGVVGHAQLREAARRHGTSASAVLVSAVRRAASATSVRGRRVRVSVPIDARRHLGAPDGIGNAVFNAATHDRADRRRSFELSVQDSHRVLVDAVGERRLGATWRLYRAATRPGHPRAQARRRARALDTAVASNLGPVAALPHWDGVESVAFAPPAHVTTSVGFVGLRGEVSVTVRARAAQPVVDEVLDLVMSELAASAPDSA